MTQIDRDFSRGFLPPVDPLACLPEPFSAWEEVAQQAHKLILSDHLRRFVDELPPFPAEQLHHNREQVRGMVLLSYLASLYVLSLNAKPLTRLPAGVAVPLCQLADQLAIPPILSYALQTMYNWRRVDPAGPIALGNLTLNQNFLGGMDEEWFVTIHVNIEAEAGRALKMLLPAQQAVREDNPEQVITCLEEIGATLQTMYHILGRMDERCDPYIYYNRVRPFMFGWKNNPDMPDGLLYEGVAKFNGRPQQFRGETGAQSGVIPAIDSALGISHEFDEMRAYLMEMREYMPPKDRAFIEEIEQGASIRHYAITHKTSRPAVREAYNEAVTQLEEFRARHIEYAARYIIKPAPQGEKSAEVGTGGTPFTVYLKKHIRETAGHLI